MTNYSVTSSTNDPTTWKAFDGNTNTSWIATFTGSDQVTFDFKKLLKVKGVRFTPTSDQPTNFPSAIDFKGVDGNGDTVLIKHCALTTPIADTPQSFVFESPVSYSKYVFELNGSTTTVAIAEIDFLVSRDTIIPAPSTEIKLQEKIATPSESDQIITPDETYDGLSKVTISSAKLQKKKVAYSSDSKIITPDNGFYGLSEVEIESAPSSSTTEPKLQSKTAIPITSPQDIFPDVTYDGLSKVTVEAIPDQFKDTSDATASASDILSGKTAYINGEKVVGTAAGVNALPTLQEKTATPTTIQQKIKPDADYDGLSEVTVEKIPEIYKDTSDATASAADIVVGKTAYINGQKVTGTASGTGATPKLQKKSVIPTAFEQKVEPDATYDGLSQVTVSAIPEEPQNTEYRWWSPNMSSNTTPSPYQVFGDSLQSLSYTAFDNNSNSVTTIEPPTNDADSVPEIGFDFGIPVKVSGIKIAGNSTNIDGIRILGNNSGVTNDFIEITYQEIYDDLELAQVATITFDPVAYRFYKFLFVEHDKTLSTRQVKVSDITFYREFVVSNVNLQEKSITPSTSVQTVTPDGQYDGLSKVTVGAVNLQTKSVNPSTTQQIVTPDNGNIGLSSVTVEGVSLQSKTIAPTGSQQIVNPDSSYSGLSSVTVDAIPSAYKDTSDATASASDILSGKTAYVNGSKVTGSMSSNTLATPTISVTSAGKITASVTQSAGYTSGGTKSATQNLTTKSAETFTPTTSNQTISSGQYLTGVQTIKGDSNLKAANIKSGVSIFGVSGSYEGATPSLQSRTVTPTTSKQTITPGTGYDGLSSVIVNATPLTTKTVTPSTSSQTLTPTSSYVGFSSVTVNAIPSSYTPAGILTITFSRNSVSTADIGVSWLDVGTNGTTFTHKRSSLSALGTIHIRMGSMVEFLSFSESNNNCTTVTKLSLSGTSTDQLVIRSCMGTPMALNSTTVGFAYTTYDTGFLATSFKSIDYNNSIKAFTIDPKTSGSVSAYSANYTLTLTVTTASYSAPTA